MADLPSYLTDKQIDLLLRGIHERRVRAREGMSYVEAHDIKAEMIRVFGFARWSSDVLEQVCLYEQQVTTRSNKPAWEVGYRSLVMLTVCAPDGTKLATYTEGHASGSTHPLRYEAHANALTNSESYAFKRAAVLALADQGGLGLYNNGSLEPFVRWTLVSGVPTEDEATDTENVPEVAPETAEGADPPWTPEKAEAANAAAMPEVPVTPPDHKPEPEKPADTRTPDDFRDALLNCATKAEVRGVLRAVGMAQQGDAEVGDEQGEPVTLTVLATRLMKALPA